MFPKIGVTLLAVAIALLLPAVALSTDPMAAIRGSVDDFIAILVDPKYQKPGMRMAQHEAIWDTVSPIFNFEEVSRRSVARHWRDFSDAERSEFVEVFAQFLGNTYIEKVQGGYHNERSVYLSQEFLSDNIAEVRTLVVRDTLEVSVNYRMIKGADGQWKVYDVIVEGISLVQNYRSQFASILRRETPTQLIQRLNERLDEQRRRLADRK